MDAGGGGRGRDAGRDAAAAELGGLVDRELYLPKSWTDDRDRCRQAAVPDDVQFATKPELARAMLGRALDAGLPAAWVTADEAYGRDLSPAGPALA